MNMLKTAEDIQEQTLEVIERSTCDLTILYGSQSGNAEFLAFEISESAEKAGLSTELLTLNDALKNKNLSWNRLLIVTATHDNGHMPDNAAAFWEWLQLSPEGQYEGLPYSVLSIGDSMYDDFCKAGHDLDSRLKELGAVQIIESIDCDVDYDMTSVKWVKEFLKQAQETEPWTSPSETSSFDASSVTIAEEEPFYTAVITNSRVLSLPGSLKKVIHYECEVEDGFEYLVGDSVDIYPSNPEILVNEWLNEFSDTENVLYDGAERAFEDVLKHRLELRLPHLGLAVALAEKKPESPIAQEVIELLEAGDRHVLEKWLWNRDVIDIIREIDACDLGAQQIVDMLRPIQHRSYSIASSPLQNNNSVHLTVGHIEFYREERKHIGAGTSFLEELAATGERFSIRRVQAHDFKLPEDDSPIIMIGPGVGVAPFIGFLKELEHSRKNNQSWLFFGDQHREFDWIYREEMESWQNSGVLTKLSLAFSRDTDKKQYVQHEMFKNSAEILEWVERGAYIYVCGDKSRMAHDVEEALVEILAEGSDTSVGLKRVEELKASLRYLKDVY